MKISKEVYFWNDFDFWSGAEDTVKYLTCDEIETIFAQLTEIYPDGMTDTEFNDFFWFETDCIAQMLGYDNFEEIMNRENEQNEQNEEDEENG